MTLYPGLPRDRFGRQISAVLDSFCVVVGLMSGRTTLDCDPPHPARNAVAAALKRAFHINEEESPSTAVFNRKEKTQ